MKRRLLSLATVALLAPLAVQAQTTGSLAGKVTNDKGEAIRGATIRILGTSPVRGAISKEDGSFLIAGVRADQYDIQVTAVGYKNYLAKDVRVSVDQTTTLNARMVGAAVVQDSVIVTAQRDIIVADRVGKQTSITGEQMQRSSRTNIQGAVALSSGVTTGGVNGFSIRGGRASETSIRVDGVEVSDPFSGGFGSTSASYYPTVSTLAVQEVQVISSGFGSEYGDVLSGVVNSVTRNGRSDRYEGTLNFRAGVPFLFGSSSPITVKKAGTDIDTTLPGAKLQGSGSKLYEFGFGGPIPGLDRLTFFIAGKYNHVPVAGSSYEVYDISEDYARRRAKIAEEVWGFSLSPTNLGQLPNQEAMIRHLNAKFKIGITESIFMELSGEMGLTSTESGGWSGLYQLDHPTFINGSDTVVNSSVLEREAQLINQNTIINRAQVRYFQNLDPTTYFELTGSWVHHENQIGKKDPSKKYGIFDTYDIYEMTDANRDNIIDRYQAFEEERYLNQYQTNSTTTAVRNPITGLYEGPEIGGASRNPYGLIDNGNFPVHGNSRSLEVREAMSVGLKGVYETNFELGEVKTQVKTGFEFTSTSLRRHSNSLPWDVNPFFDVYGYDVSYFANDPDGTLSSFFRDPYNPIEGALYLSTRFDYKSILFQPGVRFDFLNPNTKIPPSRRGSVTEVIEGIKSAEDATLKFQISPRLGVSYPVTDRSQFRVNFAMMFKMPEYNNLYDNAFGDAQRGNQLFGNPNIEPQKVLVYEMAYEAQIADDYYLDISAFYRDIYNQTGVTYVPAIPSPYIIYSVADYGNVRGLEITARRLLANNFGVELNYTLQKAVGTSSEPGANYSVLIGAIDPYTGEQQKLPLTEYPLNYDQTHKLTGVFSLVWGDNEGPSIGGLKLLQNSDITLTANYASGLPFTRETERGQPTTEYNSQRLPSVFTTEAHLERGFKLRDFFGEGAGNLELSLFADVFNLFNITNAAGVRLSRSLSSTGGSRYSITSSPDNDGLAMNRKVGDFIANPHYREIDPNRPETWDVNQYDRFGTRYYNPYADSNLDGVVTQQERFEGYQRYVATIQSLRGAYLDPRTVAVGVRLRF